MAGAGGCLCQRACALVKVANAKFAFGSLSLLSNKALIHDRTHPLKKPRKGAVLMAAQSDQIKTESPIFIYLNQKLNIMQACQKSGNLSRFLMISPQSPTEQSLNTHFLRKITCPTRPTFLEQSLF
jgi:hypothetical protein